MTSKKNNLIVAIIIVVVAVGLMGYYLYPRAGNHQKAAPDYFTINIVDQTLPPEKRDAYVAEFNKVHETLSENPDLFNSWMELGAIKKQLGDYKGAEEIWLHATDLRPKNSLSYNNLADLYSNFLKDYDKAIPNYEMAIKNSIGEPINVSYVRNFFEFYYYYVKDNTKAEQVLLSGVENNPKSADMLNLTASFYQDQGSKSKALEYYQRALEADSSDQSIKDAIDKLK